MLFKNAKTCIKTNWFLSKSFSISRSIRQICPISPFSSIIQAIPILCAIRANVDIQGIKIPTENGHFETKLSMFADDTQLINKSKQSAKKFLKYWKYMKNLPVSKLTSIKQKVC